MVPATLAVKDRVYRALIEIAPASNNLEIVTGRGGLRERGIADYSQYGNLPKTPNERKVLVEKLIERIAKESREAAVSFAGVPGFWMDPDGDWRLGSRVDSNDDMILIPFVGRDGRIVACQIRFMRQVAGRSGNYVWLSSAREHLGSSPGSPLHHACPGSRLDMPVLVTEGALKAATVQRFLTDRYVVGNSGVATAHREIVEVARNRELEIAFDNDSITNPHVARALAALVRARWSDRSLNNCDEKVRIVAWDVPVKGLDEAVLTGAALQYLTVSEWLKKLSPECVEVASMELFRGKGTTRQECGLEVHIGLPELDRGGSRRSSMRRRGIVGRPGDAREEYFAQIA